MRRTILQLSQMKNEPIDVKQLQKMSIKKSTIVVRKQSHFKLRNDQHEIDFIHPIYHDDGFVVVKKNIYKWFMV